MYSSSEYYSMAQGYLHLKEDEEKKYDAYLDALIVFNFINNPAKKFIEELETANDALLSGGYLNGKESLDNGELKKIIDRVKSYYDESLKLREKTDSELSQISKNIGEYQEKYNEAMRNFRIAKESEW